MSKKLWILAVICLLLCILCLVLHFSVLPVKAPPAAETPRTEAFKPQVKPEPTDAAEPEPEQVEPYVSPVDFAALQEVNPDIYAWLSITNSDVSHPLVQNKNDALYLDHNADGEYDIRGALFTESAYNAPQLDDPITVVYGHRMNSGEMFGTLQMTYSSLDSLREHSEIVLYTPEKELHYRVFAAVSYDNRHIPHNYGDGTARSMLSFLTSITAVRRLDTVIDEEVFAAADDKLLVLSTCLKGEAGRFIVAAKLV